MADYYYPLLFAFVLLICSSLILKLVKLCVAHNKETFCHAFSKRDSSKDIFLVAVASVEIRQYLQMISCLQRFIVTKSATHDRRLHQMKSSITEKGELKIGAVASRMA